jgi:molybdopterin synthase sulfur carrier subunit
MMDPATRSLIRVRVLLFSVLRERVGQDTLAFDMTEGTTGGEMLDRLAEMHEAIRAYRSHIRLAVNAAYADEAVELNDGDEIALITPTSGG